MDLHSKGILSLEPGEKRVSFVKRRPCTDVVLKVPTKNKTNLRKKSNFANQK